MNDAEMILHMKQERSILEKEVSTRQERIGKLTSAISALEGTVTTNAPEGPSVVDMILDVARACGPKTVFDHQHLVAQATAKYPGNHEKLKRGVYSAVVQLIKNNKIKRAPGGFELC